MKKLLLAAVVVLVLNSLVPLCSLGQIPLYPLKISENKRYFVDQSGQPFLIHGDTAWSLIAQLSVKDTEFYLDRRKSQGFNSILVNLIENKFSNNPPKNAAGEEPFKKVGDLSTLNEKYFAHADAIIDMAAEKGILVFLVPAYLGWKGGDEGWYRVFKENGRQKLRQYGRYLGNRYKHHSNIIWVVGGDYTPSWWYRWTVNEVAEGIRESGADQLMTAHCGFESPVRAFGSAEWLDFNNVYRYSPDIPMRTRKEYERRPIKPFILIESVYEGEHNAPPERIRRQAYWTLLTGAAGHFYGNNPVWNFGSSAKIFPTEVPWKESLNSRGAEDMAVLWKLFQSVRWKDLAPDSYHRYLVDGQGQEGTEGYSPAAAITDGNLVIAYASALGHRSLKFDLSLASSAFHGFWYDPTNGNRIQVAAVTSGAIGYKEFMIPGRNHSGVEDWVLVINAESSQKPQ